MTPSTAHSPPPTSDGRAPATSTDGAWRLELAAVVLLAAIISFHFRGHFIKPQSDFHEFAGTGRQLLDGELPRTFKRAPLFPLIIAGGGRLLSMVAPGIEAADQVLAEWFNALVAPLNAALVYLIARRWLAGRAGARWIAAWSALLPLGVWCGANAIVETPLVATILLTIWFAQRGSAWAYAAAMLAMLLRYDAAGVLAGLIAWDLLRRQAWWRVGLRATLASLPMGVWLTLTLLYWNPADGEHYIAQIRDRHAFGLADVRWATEVTFAAILEPVRLTLPAVAAGLADPLTGVTRVGLYFAAIIGVVVLLAARSGAALVMLTVFVGYVAVHAVFPFREYRFAYPMAPLVQLAAGVGIGALATWAGTSRIARAAAMPLLIGALLLTLLLLAGEFIDLRSAAGPAGRRATQLTYLVCAGLLLVWMSGPWRRDQWPQRMALLAAVLLGGRLHARAIEPLMGSGIEMKNLVEAARWARDHTQSGDRIVSTFPGLLQMYAGYEPRGRFIGFQRIKADRWPDIVRELRDSGITHVIWHERIYAEAGPHYIAAWGLERFAVLGEDPSSATGLRIEKIFLDDPNLWVFRVKDAPSATRPAGRSP